MQQEIIIRKNHYQTYLEDDTIDKLKVDYERTSFSTYDPSRNYLHIQVGEYDDFNLYVEMDEWRIEKLIKQLEEQLKKVKYGF